MKRVSSPYILGALPAMLGGQQRGPLAFICPRDLRVGEEPLPEETWGEWFIRLADESATTVVEILTAPGDAVKSKVSERLTDLAGAYQNFRELQQEAMLEGATAAGDAMGVLADRTAQAMRDVAMGAGDAFRNWMGFRPKEALDAVFLLLILGGLAGVYIASTAGGQAALVAQARGYGSAAASLGRGGGAALSQFGAGGGRAFEALATEVPRIFQVVK